MKGQDEGIVSTIIIAEVLTGFTWQKTQKKMLRQKNLFGRLALNGFKIVTVTLEITDLAANLKVKRGGRLPDALIISKAITQSTNLMYSQYKDLQRYDKDTKIYELS
jgi:predicted nucleic acid-binding protein